MSHQPFPKKGANLIKNTDPLKDSQVTYSTRTQNTMLRSASHLRKARNTNILGLAAKGSLFGIRRRRHQAQNSQQSHTARCRRSLARWCAVAPRPRWL